MCLTRSSNLTQPYTPAVNQSNPVRSASLRSGTSVGLVRRNLFHSSTPLRNKIWTCASLAMECEDLGTRRLSEIRLIDCGCAGFGQILRSCSCHRPHYVPQTIEQSDSTLHTFASITKLGQPPNEGIRSKIFYLEMGRSALMRIGYIFFKYFKNSESGVRTMVVSLSKTFL